jgi:hypothetical protein
MLIYEMAAEEMTTLELMRYRNETMFFKGQPSYFKLPGQLLRVSCLINEGAVPMLYGGLQIRSCSLYAASQIIRTISDRSAGFVVTACPTR